MKRISVRRKKKDPVPPPPPAPEPKPQEADDSSDFSSSEPLNETQPLNEAIANLKVAEQQQVRPQIPTEPQVSQQRSPTLAQSQPRFAQNVYPQTYYQQKPSRSLGGPSAIPYDKPLRRKKSKRNMSYRSPYGPGTWNMSTQDKARMFYYSCFG